MTVILILISTLMLTATSPWVYDNFKNEEDVSPVVELMAPKHVVNLKTWQTTPEILFCVTDTLVFQ